MHFLDLEQESLFLIIGRKYRIEIVCSVMVFVYDVVNHG